MFTLDQVVPWGRSFGEYERMFALGAADLRLRILGCGDGPAAFNAEATRRGATVVSCDPLYAFSREQIKERIDVTYDQVIRLTRQNEATFVWDEIPSVENLGRLRMASMTEFLADYDAGRREGRYLEAQLPELPFPDGAFDLALCSHLLFLYSEQLSEAFHCRSAVELCRVGREVRIFPLLTLIGERSPHLPALIAAVEAAGCVASVERVPYEFQRGGNEMLRVTRPG